MAVKRKEEAKDKNIMGSTSGLEKNRTMRCKIQIVVAVIILGAISAEATPKMLPYEYSQQILSFKPRLVTQFLLGLHGELFWSCGAGGELCNNRIFAVRKENGNGIELLAEKDYKFILYAEVTPDGTVNYVESPEAKALTGTGFCGIRKWPSHEIAIGVDSTKVRVFVDLSEAKLPERPKECEAVFYALSDGGYFYCQPNGIYSPYPLWLLRLDKNHMHLVSSERNNVVLFDIDIINKNGNITFYRDAFMKEINPPVSGIYDLVSPESGVSVPDRTWFYLSPEYPNYYRTQYIVTENSNGTKTVTPRYYGD